MKDDKFEMRSEWEWNPDVPAETRLKHEAEANRKLHRKVGELESEILYLKDEVSRRDKAIADFKKWQGKVAKLKIEEWILLAKQRLSISPEILGIYYRLRGALRNKSLFESQVRRLDNSYSQYQKYKEGKQNEHGGDQENNCQ